MKLEDLKNKSLDQLQSSLMEFKKEAFNLRFQKASDPRPLRFILEIKRKERNDPIQQSDQEEVYTDQDELDGIKKKRKEQQMKLHSLRGLRDKL